MKKLSNTEARWKKSVAYKKSVGYVADINQFSYLLDMSVLQNTSFGEWTLF